MRFQYDFMNAGGGYGRISRAYIIQKNVKTYKKKLL